MTLKYIYCQQNIGRCESCGENRQLLLDYVLESGLLRGGWICVECKQWIEMLAEEHKDCETCRAQLLALKTQPRRCAICRMLAQLLPDYDATGFLRGWLCAECKKTIRRPRSYIQHAQTDLEGLR